MPIIFSFNRMAPIHHIPIELLRAIFDLAVYSQPLPDDRDPRRLTAEVVLSHVCRHWRQVALDNPLLWTLIHFRTHAHFNRARTYLDLAHAVCDAAGVSRRVEFIPMPDALRGQYQSFTEARMDRLRAAGYAGQFTPLEDGVRRYVQHYLGSGAPYA